MLFRSQPEALLEPPSRLEVVAAREPRWWMDLVARATTRIRAGELRKVVLAREVTVTADRPVDPRPALRRLRASYPTCFVSYIDGFLCASPELLVSRDGDVVRAHPKKRPAKPLHGVEITPELREKIMKGMPAFKQGGMVQQSLFGD